MNKFIKILLIFFLINTNIVNANDKNNTCVYITVKEGNVYKVTKLGNCNSNSETIIYRNTDKKTI